MKTNSKAGMGAFELNIKISLIFFIFMFPLRSGAGQLDLGVDYQGWNSSYELAYNGWEILSPLSMSLDLDKGFRVYGETEYAVGHYNDNYTTPSVNDLSALSDTMLGVDFHFENFSVPGLLNIAVNVPTGDTSWESKQLNGNIPSQFVDSRYRGRGFGANILYGLSFPSGSSEVGVAAGYMYSGAFNPNYDLLPFTGTLKLCDTIFAAINHYQAFKSGEYQVIRLTGYYFMPTQEAGVNSFQMGPNINASYSWNNTKAFSFEVGGQYFFKSSRASSLGGTLVADTQNFYAPRFYLTPSYTFGQVTFGAVAKYIMANGYSVNESFYDGGGLMVGLQPSWRIPLDGISSLRFTGAFDDIISHNSGIDLNTGDRADVNYYRWTFGTNYEIKL